MRQTIWNKRIPTLFGLILILIGIVTTTYLVQTGVIVIGRARETNTPQNIRITNIQDTSFSVSYTTKEAVAGSLSYGEITTLGNGSLDDRDQETGNVSNYKIHHITLKNLKPKTQYYFSITSGGNSFVNKNLPFEVSTAAKLLATPSAKQPIVGKVVTPDGEKPKEGIVYITTPNGQILSTLIKNDESYIIPLNSLRTIDLSSYFEFLDDTILNMLIISDSFQSEVNLLAKQIDPVPLITLSKNYDFVISESPVASVSAFIGFPSLIATESAKTEQVKITTPKENESFTDPKPVFKGTALPSSTVKITIESEEKIKGQVISDKNGTWNFRPEKALPPGQHTITIEVRDRFGILKTIKQSFVVFAQGSQVQESATPSATPTLKVSPTPTPTLTLTPTPTPVQTITPTPTIVAKITPIVTPPAVGDSALFVTGVAALITTSVGVLLFFISRAASL